jgi:GDPmannose 4,6-dehydratase
MKIALITGITGQDGSYLADFLLGKNYIVHGLIRYSSTTNTQRIEHILDKIHLHYGDITDIGSLITILNLIKTTYAFDQLEIYHLAAQSHVGLSFSIPVYTANIGAMGTLNLLEAIRQTNLNDKCRLYQASTSELYGKVHEIPQTERTQFHPRSPYAVAKLFSYWMIINYREAYNFFACNGILFNHESPRRGINFVTRKITKGISDIINNRADCITLGNLNSKRDWGSASDYVEAMWLILQQDHPDDYLIATGQNHTIREFVERAFEHVNISIKWRGSGFEEVGYDEKNGMVRIRIDKKYFRPSEVDELLGDATSSFKKLGWRPKTDFETLVKEMVDHDLKGEDSSTF